MIQRWDFTNWIHLNSVASRLFFSFDLNDIFFLHTFFISQAKLKPDLQKTCRGRIGFSSKCFFLLYQANSIVKFIAYENPSFKPLMYKTGLFFDIALARILDLFQAGNIPSFY